MTPTTGAAELPEALQIAEHLDAVPENGADPDLIASAAACLRRLHAYCQELESQVIADCMTHGTGAQVEALTAAQAGVPAGYALVSLDALKGWGAAFAEELAAYDLDPPLHHIKEGHDAIEAILAAAPQPSPSPTPAQPDFGTLTGLAKQYADSYASPHHFTLGVNGLRQIIQRCSPQPVQDGEIPESVIDAVAAAEIGKSMQGGQHVE